MPFGMDTGWQARDVRQCLSFVHSVTSHNQVIALLAKNLSRKLISNKLIGQVCLHRTRYDCYLPVSLSLGLEGFCVVSYYGDTTCSTNYLSQHTLHSTDSWEHFLLCCKTFPLPRLHPATNKQPPSPLPPTT